jgi:hypothetical protein
MESSDASGHGADEKVRLHVSGWFKFFLRLDRPEVAD